MRKVMATFIAFCLVLTATAQYKIGGKVLQQQLQALEGATVGLHQNGSVITATTTNGDGSYEFKKIKKGVYQLAVEFVGFAPIAIDVNLQKDTILGDLTLAGKSYFLEPLEVKSLRASEKAPFAKTNISKTEIGKNNLGQDLPFILSQTPGAVANSDAGNGIGYTALRIRGSDATRINVTVNGIPYNDAESQGSYFVDLPDVASSVNSIQIQRGVGSSSNGAGAFGASLNLSTIEYNDKAYGQFNNSFGSFNAWKNTVKAGTGLIDNHFTVDARLSRISSNGYIDRASTDMKSLYLSTAYLGSKSTIRFNFITGKEKTYQAWYGIEESILDTNRRYNPAGSEKPGEPYNNQTDNYQQDHYQLFFNHSFTDKLSFNTALFLTKGKGYYEEYKGSAELANYALDTLFVGDSAITKSDLVRQLWLDNNYYGQILSFQYKSRKDVVTVGGGWNIYEGKHFGRIIWSQTAILKDYEWYRHTAKKTDINAYTKWERAVTAHLNLYADLQHRKVNYTINGFKDNPTVLVDRQFNFFNPKAGVSYYFGRLKTYFSYALANKEPNRDDFETGKTQQPKHETLHDFELGVEKAGSVVAWSANAYYMLYKNQLILTGQINDVGAYTRVNVPNSYRAGVELQTRVNFAPWLRLNANVAVSENKIKASEEYIDNYDSGYQVKISHGNTAISFSPSVVGGATLTFMPVRNAEISFISKYVSRQYLDNAEDVSRSLNPYYVQDLRLSYTIKTRLFKEINLIGSVCNLLNKKYEPNGYTFSYIYGGKQTTENYYFPMASRNFMAGINITL